MLRQLRDATRFTRYGLALGAANQLPLLARAYGDTDKWHHGYMPHYARHFGPHRFRANVVLEIGVGPGAERSGGSLRVWRDYFLRSTIIGMDIDPKSLRLGRRVRFHLGDQADPESLAACCDIAGVPNVVIDDGSHVGEHQIASFEYLWPRLPSGAIYVIEDLSTSYYPSHGGGVPSPESSGIGLLRRILDDVQACDNTFVRRPELGQGPTPAFADVAEVSVYPGIGFARKA